PKAKKKRLQPSPISPTDLSHEETYEEYASPPPKLPHPRPTSQITTPSPYPVHIAVTSPRAQPTDAITTEIQQLRDIVTQFVSSTQSQHESMRDSSIQD
ncbi:MAG: hypothetical protein ACK559_13565, partial [bacterium]